MKQRVSRRYPAFGRVAEMPNVHKISSRLLYLNVVVTLQGTQNP